MIQNILDLLQADEYLSKSELIDIAKGKYELTTDYKKIKNQTKRAKAWQLKRK